MDADLDTLATALYVTTDDLLKDHPERVPPRPRVGIAPEDHRRRTGHPGGDAGAAGLHQRGPLAALRPRPAAATCSRTCPASPGYNKRLRKLAATMSWLIGALAGAPASCDDDVWVVDSTPVECAPIPGDRQALGPGRVGRVRLLRLPLPLLLGAAAAPGVHPARPARRLGADRRQGRRTRASCRHPRRRPRRWPGRHGRPDRDRRQELLRPRLRGRPHRPRHHAAAPGPQGRDAAARANGSSNPCARSSSRSTTPSKANSTSNTTAAAPPPVSAPASLNASSR